MIIFFGLFILCIGISFILAYLSMKDFQEIPSPEKNSLYLIQNPDALTADRLVEIGQLLKGEVLSLERLFKGNQSAIVIFGPKEILERMSELSLLELEDYTTVASPKTVWEMSIKGGSLGYPGNIFANMPTLRGDEQFWWQLVLQPDSSDNWQVQIRAVLVAAEDRQKQLINSLQRLASIIKIPKPLTQDQLLDSFIKRAFSAASKPSFSVNASQVLGLVLFKG